MKVTTDACLFGAWIANQLLLYPTPHHILDIGAGTGLLSLMLAQASESTRIDAIEPNQAAFQEARENFAASPWSHRMHVFPRTLQDYHPPGRYDLIVCNPPFFANSKKGQSAYKNQALHADDLSQEALIEHVEKLLLPTGALFVLYPPMEMSSFEGKIAGLLRPFSRIQVRNSADSQVMRTMTYFRSGTKETSNSELIIRQANGKYTNEFWALLEQYYLEYNSPHLG